ncbi:type I-E CRISPR-associated protein Cse2/CasB [Actinomadura graeca]|uniref:Type I-E CRISPR-associated protein Cse2/CasB n=1 Tax=Actinomadura graeca TaxID=2750812 RepID=A0ABX8R110_9ACTN|nr:type I-E CRISPR-associated protein Cse2/CasB [Actinomadura graeca]QXJ24236.1 type I-E CRISPR-associated protein Cse2/CasB [Actinomadura graeca]
MTAAPDVQQPADLVENAAGRFIAEVQQGCLADRSAAVGALAQLRRGAGKLPQDVPDLWGVTGAERLFQHPLLSRDDQHAAHAEAAYVLAVTLYALHQQSQGSPMHKKGVDLGQAVRRLMPPNDIDEPIRRRFVRAGTAATPQALAYRLREIVSLLRGQGIPLDYGRLARQLYHAQTPDGMSMVRRDWGRSFHTYKADSGNDASIDKDSA